MAYLFTWGTGAEELGQGGPTPLLSATQLGTDSTWDAVSTYCAGFHTLALRSGEMWVWGYNDFGAMGLGATTFVNTPTRIGTANNWTKIAAGLDHSMAIKADGTLWAFGRNFWGELGLGDEVARTVPTQVGTANDWDKVFSGLDTTYAIKTDGSLWVVGRNDRGQLALNDLVYRTSFVQVGVATDWVSISAGGQHALAIRGAGTLWGVGLNDVYQLGTGNTTNSSVFIQIGTTTTWTACAAGGYHSAGLLADGTLWTWGAGFTGRLAHGDTLDKTTPTQVGTATDWIGVSASEAHTFARKAAQLYGAGQNLQGQLGQGNTTQSNSLLLISMSKDVTFVAGGLNVTVALAVTPKGSIAPTRLTVTATGSSVAPTSLTVELSSGVSVAPTQLTHLATSGGSLCPCSLTMIASTSTPSAPTSLLVTWPAGASAAPTRLSVTGSGASVAATHLAVLSAVAASTWTARCMVGGVDVSARLVGQANVVAEEGAARIATVTIAPTSGAVAPLDYVGKTITLDYVLKVGASEVARRIFTGRVDTPEYDFDNATLTLDCVDDLQNRVSALARSVVDALIGGRYAAAVQGENLDGWDYAQARLSTVAASLDAGAAGDIRVTPWELASTWATYGAADLLYQRSLITFPQRSTLINRVDAEFAYRYPRLRQRYTSVGWSGSVIGGQMAAAGYAFPTLADVSSAGQGSGWEVVLISYSSAPATIPHSSGGFIHTAQGAIDRAVLYMAQRHSQSITEAYTLTVTAPESVAANGELAHAIRGALESEFDGNAWESALDVAPLMPTGGDMDWAPDATRADSDYAINTLLDQARVKILGSHRGARVTNAVLCNPDLDLNRRVAIATSAISASGKVARVAHTLDFDAGSAVTEFDIACFGVGGAGIITPDTLAPPAPPTPAIETQNWPAETASLQVSVFGSTVYSDNLMGLLANPPESITVYDVPTVDGPKTQSFPNPYYAAGDGYPVTGFRVRMPGVIDADRNPIEKPVARSYQIVVPTDPLTLTVP